MKTLSSFALAVFASVLALAPARAGELSADDFFPPAQAKTEEQKQAAATVAQPGAVKEVAGLDGKKAVQAATAQDAVNAAIKNIPAAGGCEQIVFPSGFGWVATGVSSYGFLSNPIATLKAQQTAYQKAFILAKKALAETLYGLSSEAQEKLSSEVKTILSDAEAASLGNVSDQSSESVKEMVQGMLRGFVIYKIDDKHEGQTGTVTVSIVATPKTMGKFGRPDLNSLTADSVHAGLNHVLVELSNGLLPPVGGKTISVPQTKELAFVGFGNALVVRNPNPAVQKKMELTAQKKAVMRARSALCGMIIGDEVTATSQLDSETLEMSKQFAEAEAGDPLNAKDEKAYQKLQEQKNSLLNVETYKEQIVSARKGIIPPGVQVKAFFNPERTLVNAVAVYVPSATQAAANAGEAMKNANLVQPINRGGAGAPGAAGGDAGGAPSGEVTIPALSGQISNDDDL